MIGAGNYSGAKGGLNAVYRGAPGRQAAHVDLGVANAFLLDYPAAAAAFDAAGPIPENYRAVAGKAYAEDAIEPHDGKGLSRGDRRREACGRTLAGRRDL